MMPVSRYMDSNPLHGNQIPSAQHYQPNFEAIPPLMMADPSKPVAISQPWLYSNNFGGYSAPIYACCNHGNLHGFYSYAPCPPQLHCYGYHPSFPNAFPTHYVPPPHYLRELPRYDYDKPKDNDFHCCGCPNHSHNQTNGRSVKVEELPNVEKKMDDSLDPTKFKNYAYPVFWIPNEYLRNTEDRKPLESDAANREEPSQDVKLPNNVKPQEQEPRDWKGWFPLDMKNLQSLMQTSDGRRMQDQQYEDKMRQFPFPIDMKRLQSLMQDNDGRRMQDQQNEDKVRQIPCPVIWMPPYNNKAETEKEERQEIKLPSNDINKPQMVHVNSVGQIDPELKEKSSKQRSIPVKQMKAPKENNSECAERREEVASLKNAEDNETSKASGTSTKRESSTPLKSSKLPPVCLRVDPLPNKRKGNMSSRSPSPPGFKGKTQDTSEASVSSNLKAESQVQDSTLSSSKEEEAKKNRVEVVGRSGNKDEEQRSGSQIPIPISDSREQVSSSQTINNDVVSIIKEDEDFRDVDELTDKQANEEKEPTSRDGFYDGESKAVKKVLSHDEAALRIQSAYRGFEVRKWQSLKKLKQIAQVQEQVAEARNKICGLESSPNFENEKQKALIGETIMSLLLKLDTIQGLHPSLRDVRKSLARELVTLQEKLDLLAETKSSGDPSCDPRCLAGAEEEQSRAAREHPNDDMTNAVSGIKTKETSKPFLIVNEELKESEIEGQYEPPEATGSVHLDYTPTVGKLEELQRGTTDKKPAPSAEEEHNGTCIIESQQIEEVQPNIFSNLTSPAAVVNESKNAKVFAETDLLKELSVGVIDDDEPEKQDHDEIQKNEILPGGDARHEAIIDASEEQPVGVDNEGQVKNDESLLIQQVVELLNEEPSQSNASSPEKELPVQGESDQQHMEGFDEDLSILELMNWVKVEREDDNVFLGNTIPEGDVAQAQALEINNKNELVNGSQHEERQTVSYILQKESDEEVQKGVSQGIIDIDTSSASEATTAENLCQAKELRIGGEQDNAGQPTGEGAEEELIHQDLGIASNSRKVVNQSNVVENYEAQSGAGEQICPLLTEHDEKKKEVLPVSLANNQLPIEEHENEDHEKLIEENKKMRKMVEKLTEEGKKQLDVINNLTGRVQDLEKKLSRKKMMTGRRKRATSSLSCATSSSKSRKRGSC
ncbi:BAG family molecular chaperone regulator 6 [Ricinus communis]|uniref:BAG domain-containing protein n=1 Tax=Ricinus communis TaxID=3988 RepID=B9RE03_RICCO|nr:BAG family molecular chaperone regulator 6 [Ricinus communis]EEF50611.1 hypothetical protein RCOM_1617200 [Ricinus communis]|eukprot:XP_002511942.1 BAG family molecular chaperone regulator 6 [Ricinus communis]